MSFSSRRRNYFLTPHRRDGLIEWMKAMLMHSFVLDALDETAPGTFEHFEMLIDEHRAMAKTEPNRTSPLKQLVPTVGTFHTHLPLRKAFEAYNRKYCLTARRHVQISFNELRHILNIAQIMAMRGILSSDSDENYQLLSSSLGAMMVAASNAAMEAQQEANSPEADSSRSLIESYIDGNEKISDDAQFKGPQMITFDGDQTLYKDGANFESNPKLANYLYLLLQNGVTVAVVTAAGYEYQTEKYSLRLSGLLSFFKEKKMSPEACARFYLFGGECNYLLYLGSDYALHPVKENGPGGWHTCSRHIPDSPANWNDDEIKKLLDIAETTVKRCVSNFKIRGRVIRKKRAIGLIPGGETQIPREVLDETVLSVQDSLSSFKHLSFCAFNGGRDVWVDVGNKKVGVEILQRYTGISMEETLHIGDQFLNTGNDFAARSICPCVWITDPEETTYILKSILRLAGIYLSQGSSMEDSGMVQEEPRERAVNKVNYSEVLQRKSSVTLMDVYTGEIKQLPHPQGKN